MDRRLTTIVAADLAGYSRLMAADEEGVIRRLREVRLSIVDPEIGKAGGRIIKTMGDGLLVEYPSPVAAVRSTIAIQRAMAANEAATPEDDRLRFRVGINLGDVVVDGADILGDGVNIAARLESISRPGGICISRAVHDQIRGKIDAALLPLGPQNVKNIPDPVEAWNVEIGLNLPEPKGAGISRPSIAILPFDNMSPDPDQEFLADGIVEDVITELSRFRWMFVIARNSSFAYKGSHKDVREIGRELGVRYVVEGSVRRSGDRLRVTVQLIEAQTGNHIWADRYDRMVEDLFELQDEVTRAIVTAIEPELGAHERALARRKTTDDLSAWELYQRGLSKYLEMNENSLSEAIRLLSASIEADPEFSLAYATLAHTFGYELLSGRAADPTESLTTGLRLAHKALELDHRCDAGYHALGFLLVLARRADEAIETLSKGIALNGNNALLYFNRAQAYSSIGKYDAAIDDCAAAIDLSPNDPMLWAFRSIKGTSHMLRMDDGDLEAANNELIQAGNYPNSDWPAYFARALLLVKTGKTAEAAAQIKSALRKRPSLTLAMVKAGLPISFETDELRRLCNELVQLGLPAA